MVNIAIAIHVALCIRHALIILEDNERTLHIHCYSSSNHDLRYISEFGRYAVILVFLERESRHPKLPISASVHCGLVVANSPTPVENIPFRDKATEGHSGCFRIDSEEGLFYSQSAMHSEFVKRFAKGTRIAYNAGFVNNRR